MRWVAGLCRETPHSQRGQFPFSASTYEPFQAPEGFESRFGPGQAHFECLDCLDHADDCLGRYVEGARTAGYLDDTILVGVADQAARLPGAASRPLAAQLEIPCLIAAAQVASELLVSNRLFDAFRGRAGHAK